MFVDGRTLNTCTLWTLSPTLCLRGQGWSNFFSSRSSLAFQPPTGFDSSRSWQSIGWKVKSEIGIFFSQIPSWKALLAWLLSFFLLFFFFFCKGRGYTGSLLLHGCIGFLFRRAGLLSSCSVWASHYCSFSYFKAWALGCLGFSCCGS